MPLSLWVPLRVQPPRRARSSLFQRWFGQQTRTFPTRRLWRRSRTLARMPACRLLLTPEVTAPRPLPCHRQGRQQHHRPTSRKMTRRDGVDLAAQRRRQRRRQRRSPKREERLAPKARRSRPCIHTPHRSQKTEMVKTLGKCRIEGLEVRAKWTQTQQQSPSAKRTPLGVWTKNKGGTVSVKRDEIPTRRAARTYPRSVHRRAQGFHTNKQDTGRPLASDQ